MTLIVCRKSSPLIEQWHSPDPSVSPYMVVATDMVKGCPSHGTIEHAKCKDCDSYNGECT
jgi:hypothetical protein